MEVAKLFTELKNLDPLSRYGLTKSACSDENGNTGSFIKNDSTLTCCNFGADQYFFKRFAEGKIHLFNFTSIVYVCYEDQ